MLVILDKGTFKSAMTDCGIKFIFIPAHLTGIVLVLLKWINLSVLIFHIHSGNEEDDCEEASYKGWLKGK